MNTGNAAPKTFSADTAARRFRAQQRIVQLARQLPVHRAFHWVHLHEPQLRQWQLEMLRIPAPPFQELRRAEWFLQRFHDLGLSSVHLDAEGNALGELPGADTALPGSMLLVSAHLDTVFPSETDTLPKEEGPRILAPGACDNAAGLSALLGLIASLRFAGIMPPASILFAANVGEEGEGNLRGMRYLFERGLYRERIRCALALEGSGTAIAVTRALGSRRFRVTVRGPGGHSWLDSGAPNPITLLASGIVALAQMPALTEPAGSHVRTTLSPGHISGGTSVNSIASSATVLLDLRSTDATQLDRLTANIHETFATIIAEANQNSSQHVLVSYHLELIGDRPAASLAEESPLLHTLYAVDRHLGLRTELRLGSTDANLPLSLGIPAMALACGGSGGGIHTLAEWYDPTGRETALRRLLLVLLDAAQTLRQDS